MESAFFQAWQASSTCMQCSRDITSGSHLALPARCWIVYYSCLTELFSFPFSSDQVITYKHSDLVILVDPEGFEPSTSSMPLRRAPSCAMGPCIQAGAGTPSRPSGPGGIRTRDLFSAIEARSHCATGPGCKVAELYLSANRLSRKPDSGEEFTISICFISNAYYVKLS